MFKLPTMAVGVAGMVGWLIVFGMITSCVLAVGAVPQVQFVPVPHAVFVAPLHV